MSIPFSVTPAVRTGTFGTGNITYTGGFTECFWDWDIPSSTDYNNSSNSIATQLIVNGSVYGTSTWVGGNGLDPKTGFPGAVQFNTVNIPTGATISINGIITGTFNVGIANGLIS